MAIDQLNVAQICPATEVLGPGRRFVVWVQGCPFNCRGCVSPDWIENRPAKLVTVERLAAFIVRLAGEEGLEGLTISGGEPAAQAGALAALLKMIRRTLPGFSAISFSGYTLEQLRQKAFVDEQVNSFLSELDVLIDGLYVENLNDAKGMRGSSNQKIHFLTERYRHLEKQFDGSPRSIEIHLINRDEILMVGVPSPKTLADYRQSARAIFD